jgi:hypothetical protein
MSHIFRKTVSGINLSGTMNNAIMSGTTTFTGPVVVTSPTTFTGTVGGITKAMVGLSNVDNTSDEDKPISKAVKVVLDSMTTSNNSEFTGLTSCEDINVQDLTVQNTVKINTYLHTFIKVDEKEYTLKNETPNITICGDISDIVNLPTAPLDGLCINISNMSENDLFIRSTITMYNLFLARDGTNEIALQRNFMYSFIYTENSQGIGNWYFKF